MLTIPSRDEAFLGLLRATESQIIALVSPDHGGKSTFLSSLIDRSLLSWSIHSFSTLDELETADMTIFSCDWIILDSESTTSLDLDSLRETIKKNTITARIIYTTSQVPETDIPYFSLGDLSFREYMESRGVIVTAGEFLSHRLDPLSLESEKSHYLTCGGQIEILADESNYEQKIIDKWSKKRVEILSHIFKKEIQHFDDFVHHLALDTGSVFKSDKIAKSLWISRRKVNKYRDILVETGVIFGIAPLCIDTETETSLHEKYYFSDLSTIKALLGSIHMIGSTRGGIIENFVILELRRKTLSTHQISYYRKKSGTQISIVLEHRETHRLTPIEVVDKVLTNPPASMIWFWQAYHDRIEQYMILNDLTASMEKRDGTPIIFLPHIGI